MLYKNILYPPLLRTGDKVLIISPSGCIEKEFIKGTEDVLTSWGLNVEVAQYANESYGRYGGTIEQRCCDLQKSMDDKSVKLIFCSRGGYGIVQLLDKLNFDKIQKHPKWLVGFSDITALHLAFLQNNVASLHAPMARHLTENPNDRASILLKETLFKGKQTYSLPTHFLNREGKVTGHLLGGNLAVLSALIGTPYMTLPPNPILFIEDVGETPYKIDRMMWQLKLSGILSQLSGLIIGQFSEYKEDTLMDATVYESILSIVAEYDYPVAFDCPVGHVDENYALIQGAITTLSVEKKNVIIEF